MYKQLSFVLLCLAMCLGCTDSNQPVNVVANADQEEIDNYNALIKESELRDSAAEAGSAS